jgi:rRNA-processing protein FCF1
MTAMLDTNVIDKLLVEEQFLERVNFLVKQGRLQIFITGVLKNQIRQITDDTRREILQRTLRKLKVQYVPVEFAPYGYTYGECYGGLSPDVTLDRDDFIGGNNKQIDDAMIAATASSKKYKLDYVVTDDKGFTKRLNRQNTLTKAISFEEFRLKTVQLQITGG